MPLTRCALLVAWLGLLLSAASPAGENALARIDREHAEVASRLRSSIVAVECRNPTGSERYYGSGVVVSADGLVLSAATAVPAEAQDLRIAWADGTSLPARIVFTAHETETVLLQVQAPRRLNFLETAASSTLTAGASVFAAGNPHETIRRDGQVFVSTGTLTGRYTVASNDRASRYRGEVLETDAAVNPGCDGGALADREGRLVGLLSLCYTRARWLGTAVPLERAVGSLPPEWRARLSSSARPASEPAGIAQLLRQTATGAAQAVVRLEFHRKPEPELAAAAAAAPRAAAVTQQEADASPMALRPEMAATGMLIEPRGTVLTSALNLEGVDGPITVVLADGRRYHAKARGRHVDLDIAVLKLDGLKSNDVLPVAALSTTSGLRAGSLIGVLGAPQQEHGEATFATGIVSALNRFDGLAVQNDAKTNYGNAGGPVTDLQGRCLGIVTQVGTRKCWGQSSGVSFFAPAERILEVLDELRDGKTLRSPPQPSLGIAPAIGECDREGIKLGTIVKNSPAWRAGLREGELIVAADGQVTRSWPALVKILKTHQSGQELRLQVLRGGRVEVIPVLLGAKE